MGNISKEEADEWWNSRSTDIKIMIYKKWFNVNE